VVVGFDDGVRWFFRFYADESHCYAKRSA